MNLLSHYIPLYSKDDEFNIRAKNVVFKADSGLTLNDVWEQSAKWVAADNERVTSIAIFKEAEKENVQAYIDVQPHC